MSRRLIALLISVAMCLGLAALTPTAALAAAREKPGQPAAPTEPPAAPTACTLTNPVQPKDEWAVCTVAQVDLQSKPQIGGTTTAVVTVTSQVAVQDAVVAVSASDNLSVVSAPGFANARNGVSGVGPVETLSRTADLAAGSTRTFEFRVRADSRGYGVVQARVRTGDARTAAGAEDAVQLGGASAPSPTGGLAVVEAPANAPQAPDSSPATYQRATVAGPDSLSPQAPGASCATGGWVFNNELGQQTPSMNFQVQAWDQDPGGADDFLANGVTGGSGNYNLCFESTDFDGGGGQEVYVKFISSNNVWRVRDTAAANNDYIFSTGVQNLGDPGTANFGVLQPSDPAVHRALHAFDGINLMWLWQSSVSGYLDDPGQTRQMIVNWTPTSTDGTYYSLGSNDIHLAAANPDSDHTTIHEGSHALMDALYEDAFPAAPNCNPHSIFGASSTGCAWTEGWAEWLPARVLNDPFYRFDNGASVNLENPGWTDGQAQGDATEGRVAGALIDLSDNANEAPWDRYGEAEGYGAQFEEIYTTGINEVSGTLAEYFLLDRPGEGNTGFLARTAIFANTIDYTQRDPLDTNAELARPTLSVAPSPHNYSFNTPSGYWSGVAIRGGNDNDLNLYDDVNQSTLLASSAAGGSTIDYVLVDSNGGRRTVGDDYYPRAFLFSGSGGYSAELSANTTTASVGVTSTSFGSGDIIQVRDAFLSAATPEFVRVVPGAGLDVDVRQHESTATASTWVQSRFGATAGSDSGGVGADESYTFTPAAAGWSGLVLLNKGGAGPVTIYRDQTAPTGASVDIDSGAATTFDPDVNLALSATDAETGMQDMKISVDGTFDTETFEPYSTSTTVTLPGGAGTKTVDVQFRNNAGAVTTASDTIEYTPATVPSAPTVTGTTNTGGALRVNFTPGADGGSPVTSFLAQCVSTDGGVTKTKSGASSPITVTGLTLDKSYHCRVRATNAVGNSPFSAYGATVVASAVAPSAPTVTGTTNAGGAARVAFTPGANGGSPVTSFIVSCVSTDGGVARGRTGASSPITVTGLTVDKSYHCRVRATNAVGSGPYSPYGDTVVAAALAPSAPTVTLSTPAAGQITVKFTPGYDGGSPVTSFLANCISTDGGVNKSKVGTASPLVVTALTSGKSYHCRVRATNAIGTSVYSPYGATVLVP